MANKDTNNLKDMINLILTDKENYTAQKASSNTDTTNDTPVEETCIGKNVVIEGNLKTTGPIVIMGQVSGNVISTSDIVVSGKVGGFIQGNKIRLEHCQVNDTITAVNEIVVSDDSAVNGDIKAACLVSEGVINGCVTADSVTFASSSKTTGDIVCKTISIDKGAVIEGKIETSGKK